MLALITDLHARLTTAGFHVLLPSQRETPLQGRTPGQAGGLTAYLAAHPAGYVQLEDAQPIGVSGASETYWCPVACIGPTPQVSDALARAVLLVLIGVPGRYPGFYRQVIPDTTREIGPSAYLTRPTVTRSVINGTL